MFGAWPRTGAFRALDRNEHERAGRAIAAVGLSGYAGASIAGLSVGQWHRVMFARLIMQDAAVILLDEPFSAVDERTTADLMALVHAWHAEGRTVIAVLHDVEFIRRHFPDTVLVARELVSWGPTATALEPQHLEQARRMTDRWAQRPSTHDHHHDHANGHG
jgi:zinc/manganese transport system ATP-binding protein